VCLPHRLDAKSAPRVVNSGNRSTTIHGAPADGTLSLDDRGLFIPQQDVDRSGLWTPGRTATEAKDFVGLACLTATRLAVLEPDLQCITGYQEGPAISQARKTVPHPGTDSPNGDTQQFGNFGCRITGTRPDTTQVRFSRPLGQGEQPHPAFSRVSDVDRRLYESTQASRSSMR